METPAGFDVVRDDVPVGRLRLTMARPRSAEDLIDEEAYAVDERLPYWAELWPSAHVLAEHLAGRDLRGRRVVELGCGVGLPSVVAALGGADVLATDWYGEALAFVAANAAAAGAAVATLAVDWAAPPAALLERPAADLVVGADLLYEERNGPALAALVPRILAPGGELVVADPRRPHAAALLDPMVAAGWSLTTEEVRHGARRDESGPFVRVHRLRPPRHIP
jgi:predicted nicotinamide N-methyase